MLFNIVKQKFVMLDYSVENFCKQACKKYACLPALDNIFKFNIYINFKK